ncbi:MAG: type I restriction enzyme HsdR N-terminal domain-containing protein [Bacteroidota bacterium]|nr:type I restriction enzyme HsdR N-terminal domain-containing protein [Bacteroidota bacterium]
MKTLNLPSYQFKLKQQGLRTQIFDSIRKKYVVLTPEEWVRQNFLQFLIQEKNYPASLIAVEAGLKYNQLQKRMDVLVYDKQGTPHLMVECKAPEVKINQDVFDQIARYNMVFKVKYLVVTNGMHHFCCLMDYTNNAYQYLEQIPVFE